MMTHEKLQRAVEAAVKADSLSAQDIRTWAVELAVEFLSHNSLSVEPAEIINIAVDLEAYVLNGANAEDQGAPA